MSNPNGGVSCRFTTATSYTDRGNGKLLPSGIRSVATEWAGFEYDEDFTLPPKHKTFKEYRPEGMIRQLPALSKEYKGRNLAGGRKALVSYIGKAHKHMKYGDIVKVYFAISSGTITLAPRSGA